MATGKLRWLAIASLGTLGVAVAFAMGQPATAVNKGDIIPTETTGKDNGWSKFHRAQLFLLPGRRIVAYAAERSGRKFIIVGEKKGEEFDDVGWRIFSTDSKVVAYTARKDAKQFKFIVVNDNKGEECGEVMEPRAVRTLPSPGHSTK